ncbi:MAG: hypothetical protein JWM51_2164 [Microbacteriaceae bacterium]|nr:hypothetical protein [Microbacteriaceae bacterium]
MPRSQTSVPDFMPVLSVGRHRSPKRGACFMEYASHLSGERWSDHPACTHPAVAALARAVNDCTTDEARAKLIPLIPSVIGLTGRDDRMRLIVSIRASAAALPVASESRQRAVAVGLAHCEVLVENDSSTLGDDLRATIRGAFDQAPSAERWARAFISTVGTARAHLESWTVDKLVALSVVGIAEACVADSDERLVRLLSTTIDDCVADRENVRRRAQVDTVVPARRDVGRDVQRALVDDLLFWKG